MKMILTTCGILIAIVAIIHFYWMTGGRKWLDAALPTISENTKAFIPPMWMTLLVAIAFSSMALGLLGVAGWYALPFSANVQKYLTVLVGTIFILRSIGDFRYFGFFRKKRDTLFDYWDKVLYSPGTLLVGLSILLAILNQ